MQIINYLHCLHRLVVRCYPAQLLGELDDIPIVHPEESISYSSIDLLTNAAFKEPSPFSSKRVVHESDTPHGKTSCPTQGLYTRKNHKIIGVLLPVFTQHFLISYRFIFCLQHLQREKSLLSLAIRKK